MTQELAMKEYGEESLNDLITDNIYLLRKIIGADFNDVYEDNFGEAYAAEDAKYEHTPISDSHRNKVLEQKIVEFELELARRAEDKIKLEKELQDSIDEAKNYQLQYESLSSEVYKSNEYQLEHYNLIERFNTAQNELRQAIDTHDKLDDKLKLREQVLQDSELIRKKQMGTETLTQLIEDAELGTSARDNAEGLKPYSPTILKEESKPNFDLSKPNQLFFLADSAATAMEMERLRVLLRKVGERLQQAEESRKDVSKQAAFLSMKLDKAEETRKNILIDVAKTQGEQEYKPIVINRGINQKVYLSVPDLDATEKEIEDLKIKSMLKDYEESKKVELEKAERVQSENSPDSETEFSFQSPMVAETSPEGFSSFVMNSAPSSAYNTVEKSLADTTKIKSEEIKTRSVVESAPSSAQQTSVQAKIHMTVETQSDETKANHSKVSTSTNISSPSKAYAQPVEVQTEVKSGAVQTASVETQSQSEPPLQNFEAGTQTPPISNDNQTSTPAQTSYVEENSIHSSNKNSNQKRLIKISPLSRQRVPKNLTEAQINRRLQEISQKREAALSHLSFSNVHDIAEEELEERVLLRRLKKLQKQRRR